MTTIAVFLLVSCLVAVCAFQKKALTITSHRVHDLKDQTFRYFPNRHQFPESCAILALHNETNSSNQRVTTESPHNLTPQQFVYVTLTSIFITCLIIADVIGVKIFELQLPFKIFGHSTIEHTCGMITFPVTFLLGDIINEYYGPQAAKQTTYMGLGMSILVFVVMNIAQSLPFLKKPFNGEFIVI